MRDKTYVNMVRSVRDLSTLVWKMGLDEMYWGLKQSKEYTDHIKEKYHGKVNSSRDDHG